MSSIYDFAHLPTTKNSIFLSHGHAMFYSCAHTDTQICEHFNCSYTVVSKTFNLQSFSPRHWQIMSLLSLLLLFNEIYIVVVFLRLSLLTACQRSQLFVSLDVWVSSVHDSGLCNIVMCWKLKAQKVQNAKILANVI